jgi:hypothetical protein
MIMQNSFGEMGIHLPIGKKQIDVVVQDKWCSQDICLRSLLSDCCVMPKKFAT